MPKGKKVKPMRQVRFDNHVGEKLAGTMEEPAHPTGWGVVLGHCFTCSRHTRILSDISAAMADTGHIVLRFDFSGNGQSEGDFSQSTYSKQITELGCATDYIRTAGASHVILAGHSMGGTVALMAAALLKGIHGVIALSVGSTLLHPGRVLSEKEQTVLFKQGTVPFSSRGRDLTLTTDFFEDAEGYDLPGSVSKIRCPVLLIYGGRDAMIEPDAGRILKDARPTNTEVFTVDEADHMFVADRSRRVVVEHIVEWVKAL